MSTRYSDYIKIQDFLPVYDMMDEKPNMWRTFIPTKQFSDLLQRSITAIPSTARPAKTDDCRATST